MNDSEFRSELVDALNSIAVNTSNISKKMEALNERLDSLEGINGNVHCIASELSDISIELETIRKNGLPVDC